MPHKVPARPDVGRGAARRIPQNLYESRAAALHGGVSLGSLSMVLGSAGGDLPCGHNCVEGCMKAGRRPSVTRAPGRFRTAHGLQIRVPITAQQIPEPSADKSGE